MRYDPVFDLWFLVDWHAYSLAIWPLDKEDAATFFGFVEAGSAKCVKITPQWHPNGTARIPVLYCVGAIKHLLGIKSFAVTPYQLYCHLLAIGGKEI